MKLWAILGAGLWLCSGAASAQEEGPRLSFDAPEHCGDESLFRDLVAARLGDDPFGSGLALFRLEIQTDEGENTATLRIVGESGELSEREFRNANCPELMEEVAASLASLVAEIPPTPVAPIPAPVSPAPPPQAPPAPALDPQPDPSESAWRLGGGLAAGLRFDTGGDAYVGGRALFFARRGPWSVRARVGFGMSPSARVQPVLGVSPDLRLIRVSGGADACRHWQAWNVCAGVTAGALRAQLPQASSSAPFMSVDLEAGVDVVSGAAGALRLFVGVSTALAGADATLNGTEFWSSGLMSVALWVGYESPSE